MKELVQALVRAEELIATLGREDQITFALTVWRKYGGVIASVQTVQNGVHRSVQNRGSNRGSHQVQTEVRTEVQREMNESLCPASFLQFWSEYPKKTGKQEALRIWIKLKPDQQLEARILQAVREQKTSEDWTKDGGRFIPHPKTWLNQGRWDDEPMVHRSLARRLFEEGSGPNAQP